MKRQSQNQSSEPLVDKDRAVAVPPVQRKKAALAWTKRLRLRRQLLVAFAIRLDLIDEPVEDIAYRGLPCLEPELSGKHGFRHDAAETGHIRQVLQIGRASCRERRWNREVATAGYTGITTHTPHVVSRPRT